MTKTVTTALAVGAGLIAGVIGERLIGSQTDDASAATFSAVPGAIGAQDISGPYDVVEGWPQDLATLPGHQAWTYGAARGIFAESPDRVFLLGGGELPNMPRPQQRLLTDVGPNVLFPVGGLPWRNANQATPPGNGG
ncbi:MAG: hypothetical protein OEQ25_17025, partial [Gammaproteobacteria bacterium]|nr:hypothetical protein [Gammaproteobacteria bacterium]